MVPPGVRLNLLLGDGRAGIEAELGDKSGESDLRRVGGRGDGLVMFPSSVRALALPVLKRKSVNFGSSNGAGDDHFLPTDEMGIPRERMAVIETEKCRGE